MIRPPPSGARHTRNHSDRGVLVCAAAKFSPTPSAIRRPWDYFELAWLACSLATIGGALGVALETEDAVHHAAYVRRFDAQAEKEETL